jgi:hypothetical protein
MQIKSFSKMAENMEGYDKMSAYFLVCKYLLVFAFFYQSTFIFWIYYTGRVVTWDLQVQIKIAIKITLRDHIYG